MAIGRPITETPNIADKIISIIATAGQTEFTVTGGYRVNHLAVFRNGVRLVTGRDYIAGDGLTVELIEDASLNDVLEFQVFDTFSISDAIVGNSTSQTLTGDLTVNGTFTVGANGIGTMVLNKMNVGIITSNTGIVTFNNTTASTSSATGAAQFKGGVGIAKSLFVAGNISAGGTLTYEDVTNVDSVGLVTAGKGLRVTTGGLIVTAGVSTFAGITTVTNTAALHSKQLNVSAGSTFGGAVDIEDTLSVAGVVDIADYIKHTGDTNTAIRFPADDTITAETGGSERLRITSAGKVGINSTVPGYTLDMTGDQMRLRSNASGSNAVLRLWGQDANTGGALIAQNSTGGAAPLYFYHSNSDLGMTLDSSGRVLIGTTTEGEADSDDLTIATSGHTGITIRSGTSSDGAIFFSDGTSGDAEYQGTIQYLHGNNDMLFKTAATQRVRITEEGNLGLGNNSAPVASASAYDTASLHIHQSQSGSYGSQIHLSNNATGAAAGNGVHISMWSDDDLYITNQETDGQIKFSTGGNADCVMMNDDGRLLVGATASDAMYFTGRIQVQGTNSSTSAITIKTNQNDSGGPALVLGKSRGTSAGAVTVVQSGDSLGEIYFVGADGSDTDSRAASIRCNVDATPGSNDMPGRLQFFTSADGASTETERMRLDSAGSMLLGATSYGGGGAAPALYVSNSGGRQVKIHNTSDSTSSLQLTNSGSGEGDDNGLQIALLSSDDAYINNYENAKIRFATNGGTERLQITAGGDLKLGTTNNTAATDNAHYIFTICGKSGQSGAGAIDFQDYAGNSDANISADGGNLTIGADYDDATADSSIRFRVDGSNERLRIDGSGNLLSGNYFTSKQIGNYTSVFQIQGTTANMASMSIFRYTNDDGGAQITLGKGRGTSGGSVDKPSDEDNIGSIRWAIATNNDLTSGTCARIDATVDATPGGGDYPSRLSFWTCPDGSATMAERMRITNSGDVFIGATAHIDVEKFNVVSSNSPNVYIHQTSSTDIVNMILRHGRGLSGYEGIQIMFKRADATTVGSITSGASSTAYNTSSDYRRKENNVLITDGISRLLQLKPYRFNFKDEPQRTVDGFFAHEVTPVVPEAVHGEKDAELDGKGGGYQELDYSKLVTVTVAALQEALAKIETLETKVAALESA